MTATGDSSGTAPRIVVIAPRGMRFSPKGATSIDLCIRDFVRFSRYASTTTVVANEIDEPFPDVNVRFVDRSARTTQGRVREIALIIKELRPDLVIIHQHLPTAIRLRRLVPKCPIVLHVHNFQKQPATRFGRLIKAHQYKKLSAVVCVSDAVRKQYVERWAHTRIPAYTAYNGIDTGTWTAEAAEKSRTILFCGRAAPEKGVVEAAQAVAAVLLHAPEWRAEFYLSEFERYPDYMSGVRQALDFLGERARIIVNSAHEEVLDANRRASIALVPSVYEEPFGRTAIEAMATRCAVVYSRRGGLPEVVGETGIGIDEVSGPAIGAALARLVEDPALRRALGDEARLRCVSLFDIRKAARHLDDIYDTVIGSSKG
jgi:glycosyltransferase involved in cell wall biosynthesis